MARQVWSLAMAAAALGALVLAAFATRDDPREVQEIRASIGRTFDKPGSKVETDPVVVDGNHAVAGWTQGDRGGRALLRHEDGGWNILLCDGDALRHAGQLEEAGVPRESARELTAKLTEAEAAVAPERRRRFDLFDPATASAGHHHEPGRAPHSGHAPPRPGADGQ